MANPDGTKQVSPPTRSAFSSDAPKSKAVADADREAPTTSAPSKDSSDHEGKILDGLKGLIRQHSGQMFNAHSDDLDNAKDAVDKAVASTPGNSADY
jgi:hypothetical protein